MQSKLTRGQWDFRKEAEKLFFLGTRLFTTYVMVYRHLRKGRRKKRKPGTYTKNDFELYYVFYWKKLFSPQKTLTDQMFKDVFRLTKAQFSELLRALQRLGPLLTRETDCTGRQGVFGEIKALACLEMLASSTSLKKIGLHWGFCFASARQYLKHFCTLVPQALQHYISSPSQAEIARIIQKHHLQFGMNGLLGFIDCTHCQ